MQWDGEDAAHRARHRDRKLRGYVRRELGTYSPFYRRHLHQAGVDPARVRGLADLSRVYPTTWDEVAEDPGAFVVAPSRRRLARGGDRRVVLSILAGRFARRLDHVNRTVVEPRYKPVLWTLDAGVPVGSTDADLDLVAEAGSRVLALAGLERHDVLVGLTEAGPHRSHWQLVLGARAAGVSALHLGPRPAPDAVAAARPTALAGPPEALLAVLAAVADRGMALPELRTVLVTGIDAGAGVRDALVVAAAEVADELPAVVATWAPRGVRAQWGECRDGAGFHTFPDLEIIEVGRGGALHPSGRGELIWSALGWRGTAPFRLLTGARGELVDGTCEACGRKGPVVLTGTRDALDVVRLLEARDEVAAFQVEVGRRDGAEEVLVFLALRRGAAPADVLDEIDADVEATQYVVLNRRQVDARVKAAGARVVDAR